MAQIIQLIRENQKLKYQLEKFKSSNGLLPYVDDSLLKGGYRVVKNIEERDKIDCCHRKLGMKVVVIGDDLSFKEYRLISDCKTNQWEEINVTIDENEVFLTEDYSELGENLSTQRDLNLVLKQILQNLQTKIDNIELTDEKVQITEATNFAQIGQTQKDFNKSVSDYKVSSDLKNQEQDDRMSNIEGENVAQNDLINGLQADLNSKLNKPTTTSNTTSYPFVVGEDGNGNSARLPAGDLGKNFFNSDLSNTTARNHTMNAGITVNTLGNPHTLSGLPNKNADIANFRKVRVQNASGLDSIVDSKNLLTDAATSMTDAEKDAWRLAQRKTNETYSTASPQVDAILPPVINGNETFNQFVTLVGLNLFVNNSSPSIAILEIRRVKDINGIILSTPDIFTGLNIEVSQNNPTILSTSINFSNMPKGYYKAFVTHNGLTNLTSPEFFVGDVISTVPLPLPFWTEQTNGSPTISNTQISSTNTSPTTYKSAVITNASLLQNGFIAEYVCEFSGSGSGGGSTGEGVFGIIGTDNTIYGIRLNASFNGARSSVFMPDGSVMNAFGTIGLTNKMYIIYKNNIVTVINQSTGKVKSFVDPAFKTTDKKAYYSMTGIVNNYWNSGSMTFNNIKSL